VLGDQGRGGLGVAADGVAVQGEVGGSGAHGNAAPAADNTYWSVIVASSSRVTSTITNRP